MPEVRTRFIPDPESGWWQADIGPSGPAGAVLFESPVGLTIVVDRARPHVAVAIDIEPRDAVSAEQRKAMLDQMRVTTAHAAASLAIPSMEVDPPIEATVDLDGRIGARAVMAADVEALPIDSDPMVHAVGQIELALLDLQLDESFGLTEQAVLGLGGAATLWDGRALRLLQDRALPELVALLSDACELCEAKLSARTRLLPRLRAMRDEAAEFQDSFQPEAFTVEPLPVVDVVSNDYVLLGGDDDAVDSSLEAILSMLTVDNGFERWDSEGQHLLSEEVAIALGADRAVFVDYIEPDLVRVVGRNVPGGPLPWVYGFDHDEIGAATPARGDGNDGWVAELRLRRAPIAVAPSPSDRRPTGTRPHLVLSAALANGESAIDAERVADFDRAAGEWLACAENWFRLDDISKCVTALRYARNCLSLMSRPIPFELGEVSRIIGTGDGHARRPSPSPVWRLVARELAASAPGS